MCGVAGLLDHDRSLTPQRRRETAAAMAGRLAHRGPDDDQVWADDEGGLALGFRRLAIVDLSPEGRQPMTSHDGRWTVAFNGEIYNHREMRQALDAERPGAWRGRSDTEVLLEAIARHGVAEACARAGGMFAFAAWDGRERRLWLARDRFGEKPLYWGRGPRGLAFASEPKALRAIAGWPLEVDRRAAAAFLRYGYVPAPLSIWRGVEKLEPGTILAFERDGALAERIVYWDAASEAEAASGSFAGTAQEAEDRLAELLDRSVRERMYADVPVGAFLSGGIDSSAVVAAMVRSGAGPVETYSIGFAEARYDESPYAEQVAQALGTRHTTLRVDGGETLAFVPQLADYYDEPFADVSQLPTLALCRLTRRHVTVALSGDGGDELFGGYPRYRHCAEAWRRLQRRPAGLRRAAAALGGRLPAERIDAALDDAAATLGRRRSVRVATRLRRSLLDHEATSVEQLYRRYVSRWQARELPALQEPAPERRRGRLPPEARLMLQDVGGYLPDDLLVKVDRASMAFSLEVRAPLLDHRIAAFAWSLPPELTWAGAGKTVLRRLAGRDMPAAWFERPKQGFEPPLGRWLRGELKDWAASLIGGGRLQALDLVDPAVLSARWTAHLKGRRDWSSVLWPALILENWLAAQAAEVRPTCPGIP